MNNKLKSVTMEEMEEYDQYVKLYVNIPHKNKEELTIQLKMFLSDWVMEELNLYHNPY